jgi:hypothetical protein
MKIKIHKTLPVVLYGYERLCHTLREDWRLRVFENRILGPGGMRMGSGKSSTVRNIIVSTVHLI